jgi:hypothetical protein
MEVPQKTELELPRDTAVLLLSTHPKEETQHTVEMPSHHVYRRTSPLAKI